MNWLADPLVLSIIVSLSVATAHYAGHVLAGEESSFKDAGVSAAGIAVMIGAGVATYIILTRPEVVIT